jgi:hypothetical protein
MIVTTLAGYFTQRSIRNQEFALSQSEAHLKQTRETISSIYELLATVISATSERRKVATGTYDELAPQQLRTLVDDINRADARWPRERETSEMMIHLYFRPGETVQQEWPAMKEKVNAYVECVEHLYVRYQERAAPADACEAERVSADQQLERLRAGFVTEYKTALPKP